MKIFKIIIALLFGILQLTAVYAQQGKVSSDESVKGKIRMKIKPGALKSAPGLKINTGKDNAKKIGLQRVDEASASVGINRIKRVFPFSPKFEARHRKYGLHLWYEVEFDSTRNAEDIIREYKKVTEVEIVKPVYKKNRIDGHRKPVVFKGNPEEKNLAAVSLDYATVNDPLLKDQWHYKNDGRFGENGSDIQLDLAWESQTGNSEIIVAVVDTGIDFAHEDLKDNMWINEAELYGEDDVDDDQNGYVDDIYGANFAVPGAIFPEAHGTHVAGTVGAVNNNGLGVAGVAGGDGTGNGVRLMSTQVFDNRNNGGGNFAEAIVYGADNGAVISQNSWGYNLDNFYEPEVLDAIRYFVAEAGQYPGSPMKGGIVFFASGNNGLDTMRYPGAFEEVVAVTSTGPEGFPAPYANHGDWVDIAAPGGDEVNYGEEGGVLSTLPGNQYGYMQGTSMACPHVSGVAALILAKFGGENFTPEDLKRILLNSTNPFIFQHNNKYGKGILSAGKALVDDNRIPPDAITDLDAGAVFHNEVRLTWTVPHDEDGFSPSGYYLAVGEAPITASNFDNNPRYFISNTLEEGQTMSLSIGGLIKETGYWFAVKSADQFENISEISNVLGVRTTSEPHFMASTRSIEVTVNTAENPLAQVPVSFSNISEGIIYWETLVSNETYFREPEPVSEATASVMHTKPGTVETTVASASETTFDAIRYVDAENISTETLSTNKHWENDATEFVAGLSYENQNPPAILAGTGNTNSGLIFGTRFDVPYDYSFNLTHLEVALFPETSEHPITIEIKKGSRKDIMQAETVYMQEYYPDTINQLKYYRIPLYQPQKFQDNESFWVVLHFPKEMQNPMLLQYGGGAYNERFMYSKDNGRTFNQALTLLFQPLTPMWRALSTGENGSFVFLDPNKGEIPSETAQDVNITVDANSLTNGNHLASVGILTNDIHKPIVNIELKVKVEGQQPEIDNSKVFELDAIANVNNNLELDMENSGLASLEVYGYTIESTGVAETYTDTLTVGPGQTGKANFGYTPLTTGILNEKIMLHTNLGPLPFSLRIISLKEPSAELSILVDTLNVTYGSKADLALVLGNGADGAPLEFDLEHYSLVNKNARLLPEKLNYTMTTSDSLGGPDPGSWDDITGFGTSLTKQELEEGISLGLKFPFFNELLEEVKISSLGRVILYSYPAMVPVRIDREPLNVKTITYHSFGNRMVMTIHCDVMGSKNQAYGPTGNTVTYQVVLFRDGTVEYRYKDVEYITAEKDVEVFFQGLETADRYAFSEFGAEGTLKNGLVIRFSPKRSISMITEAGELNGVVIPGSSRTVALKADPAAFGFTAGNYENEVLVYTNTGTALSRIPVFINVSGTPEIEVADNLTYTDSVLVGASSTGYIRISNSGAAPVNLTAVNSNNPVFSPDSMRFPLEVPALSNLMIPVHFTPEVTGEDSGVIELYFDNGVTEQVALKAQAGRDVTFSHDLSLPVVVNLRGGESTTVPFNISNTGANIDLDYVFKNSLLGSVTETDSVSAIGINNKNAMQTYGYTKKVSDSSGVFHKWDALDMDKGKLKLEPGAYTRLELPFDFPFYGAYYSTVWISVNGYISVAEPRNEPINPEFETGDEFNGIIAPFWTQLKLQANGDGLNYRLEEESLVVQWTGLTSQNSSMNPGLVTFQMEIRSDGTIKFHYFDIEGWGGLLKYGIKSPDGTEFLDDPKTMIMTWAKIKDRTSLIINPPSHGKLPAGKQSVFNLKLNAGNMYYPGSYRDTITMVTNSISQKQLEIPVEVHVSGSPVMAVSDSLVWEEVIFRENLKLKRELVLTNKGYAPLSVENINYEGLEGLVLYDKEGNRLVRSSSGELLEPIDLDPWEQRVLLVEIPVSEKQDQIGYITYSGNFGTAQSVVQAKIADSPVFFWDAQDQEYEVVSTEKKVYSFTVENQSETGLDFQLIPAAIPVIEQTPGKVHISDQIGNYDFQDRVTVDSLALEQKQVGDGVFTPFAVGANVAFSNKFTAPEGGFNLTHIKTYSYLDRIEEIVTIMVYVGGALPQDGQKVYEQEFVIDKKVDEQWIYFPLEEPFFIPEGESFFVIMTHPVSNKYLGFDFSDDVEILQNCFSGVLQGEETYYWYPGYTQGERMVWKIRPLTASGKNQWLTLDTEQAKLSGNTSVAVNAVIDPGIAGKGTHSAKILMRSNDLNRARDEVNITIHVNGAPEFEYYPNIYADTLGVVETETKVFNYLFNDPEGDKMTA
ncbi:S8 family serine peptidase [Robertkochia flava]|uniref:S8 family serine peptidase n=1 Tax=Robertkochia flava TaxID=3447986 RepID=UPI001CCD2364|nr:S8 family serine peptidase [Robertkochia marina]